MFETDDFDLARCGVEAGLLSCYGSNRFDKESQVPQSCRVFWKCNLLYGKFESPSKYNESIGIPAVEF